MKVRETVDGSEYEMPNDLVAVLRALKGEVRLLDPQPDGLTATIQKEIDWVLTSKQPINPKVLAQIEKQKDPETWKACRDALRPVILQLSQRYPHYITIKQIRGAAEHHPFLQNYPHSIRQRVSELIMEGFLDPLFYDGQRVTGHYVLGKKLLSKAVTPGGHR